MVHTAIGFAGTVDQIGEAKRFAGIGARFVVASATDMAVTPTAGDRTVSIAAGSSQACGVIDNANAAELLQLPANSSGSTRYDLVYDKFLWTNPVTLPSYGSVQGTAGAGVPNTDALTRTPGTRVDGLLAMVRVASGQGTLTGNDIFDLRTWAVGGGELVTAAGEANLQYLDLDDGSTVMVASTGRVWRKIAGSWKYAGGNPPPTYSITPGAGWSRVAARNPNAFVDGSGLGHLQGAFSNDNTFTPNGTQFLFTDLPSAVPSAVAAVNFSVEVVNQETGGISDVNCVLTGAGELRTEGPLVSIPAGSIWYIDDLSWHPTKPASGQLP